MSDKYEGKIGPANAMNALDPAFAEAYSEAVNRLTKAVTDFENTTGRIVDDIALEQIDVTNFDGVGKFIRQASLHFLPKPKEVDW